MQRFCHQASTSGRPPSNLATLHHLRCRLLSNMTTRPLVSCGSSQSLRFRLEYDPDQHGTSADGSRFSQPYREAMSDEGVTQQAGSLSEGLWARDAPDQIRIRTPHVHRARVTPIDLPDGGFLQRLFPKEEFFELEMERNYSKEWPSLQVPILHVVISRPPPTPPPVVSHAPGP